MSIYPAIDVFNGKAVRLLKGDFNQMTVYDDDPVALAKRFETAGAQRLHVVDLNAAKNESSINEACIARVARELSIPIQLGGGIRTIERATTLLNAGVDRLIIGSMAVRDEASLKTLINAYGPRIAIAIDAEEGMVKTDGWQSASQVDALTFAEHMVELGARTLIYTDIAKDGTLSGIDVTIYDQLSRLGARIVASGGVRDIDDIRNLSHLPLEGIIVGKAIYEGTLDLKEALACLQNG